MTDFKSIKKFSAALGFLLPWRFEILVLGRESFVSPFDLVWPIGLVVLSPPRRMSGNVIMAFSFGLLAALHLRGASFAAAALTMYAIAGGIFLRSVDAGSFLKGMERGLMTSLGVAAVLYFIRRDLVMDGINFSAMYGSKNGFAFIVAICALQSARSWPWYALIYFAGARAVLLGCAAAEFLRRRPGYGVALIACFFLIWTVPSDRIEFASSIARGWNAVPWFGTGPGINYGLDLYLKTYLHFGVIGFVLLLGILAKAPRTPVLMFLLVFGLAHDPLRWPLFWFLLLGDFRGVALGEGLHQVDRHRENDR